MMKLTMLRYDVLKCGYYRHGASVAEGAELLNVLTRLQSWAKDREVRETVTFDGTEEMPVAYCQDIVRIGDDWLITLFISAENEDGQVMALNGSRRVGDGSSRAKPVRKGEHDILGHPALFFVNTATNTMAPVRYDRWTHMPSFRQYMVGFIARILREDLLVADDDGTFCMTESADSPESAAKQFVVYPRFETKPKHVQHATATIEEQRTKISSVIRSGRFPQVSAHDEDKMLAFLSRFFRFGARELKTVDRKYRFKLDYTPTKEELQALMEEARTMIGREENIWVRIAGKEVSLKGVYLRTAGEYALDLEHIAGSELLAWWRDQR